MRDAHQQPPRERQQDQDAGHAEQQPLGKADPEPEVLLQEGSRQRIGRRADQRAEAAYGRGVGDAQHHGRGEVTSIDAGGFVIRHHQRGKRCRDGQHHQRRRGIRHPHADKGRSRHHGQHQRAGARARPVHDHVGDPAVKIPALEREGEEAPAQDQEDRRAAVAVPSRLDVGDPEQRPGRERQHRGRRDGKSLGRPPDRHEYGKRGRVPRSFRESLRVAAAKGATRRAPHQPTNPSAAGRCARPACPCPRPPRTQSERKGCASPPTHGIMPHGPCGPGRSRCHVAAQPHTLHYRCKPWDRPCDRAARRPRRRQRDRGGEDRRATSQASRNDPHGGTRDRGGRGPGAAARRRRPRRGRGRSGRREGGRHLRRDRHPGQQRERDQPDGDAADTRANLRPHDDGQHARHLRRAAKPACRISSVRRTRTFSTSRRRSTWTRAGSRRTSRTPWRSTA